MNDHYNLVIANIANSLAKKEIVCAELAAKLQEATTSVEQLETEKANLAKRLDAALAELYQYKQKESAKQVTDEALIDVAVEGD